MLFKAADVAELKDSDIISKMIDENASNWYGLGVYGKSTLTRSCTPNTEYVLFAVGLKDQLDKVAATGLFRQEVKTKAE